MFYRVVMQGRTLSGADLDEVKRHFARVTGLPLAVAEGLFGGMPQVIKRQVQQNDAERIAATLRAIGAAATVERELPDAGDETPEGIQVVATPFNGPPTIIPGTGASPALAPAVATSPVRMLRAVGDRWRVIAGALVLVGGAIVVAPMIDELLTKMRPAPVAAKAAPARKAAAEVAQTAPVLNASLLHGPWRCTDQNTGASTYWTYGGSGSLIFHGDVLSETPTARQAGNAAPTGWKVDGQHLAHTSAQSAPATYTVTDLTLTRLAYTDDRRLDIRCRRP